MTNDMRQQVATYNELTNKYHALDEQIDNLLMQYGGHSEKMSDEARQQYRTLAYERDEVLNAMRALEQILFVDEE